MQLQLKIKNENERKITATDHVFILFLALSGQKKTVVLLYSVIVFSLILYNRCYMQTKVAVAVAKSARKISVSSKHLKINVISIEKMRKRVRERERERRWRERGRQKTCTAKKVEIKKQVLLVLFADLFFDQQNLILPLTTANSCERKQQEQHYNSFIALLLIMEYVSKVDLKHIFFLFQSIKI